jgi:large subunit ribosomal protein L16
MFEHFVQRFGQEEKRNVCMLQPKRTKFRKYQKGRIGGVKSHALHFGAYGIQCLVAFRLHASIIEAVRRVMTRKLKRQGQIWVRVFPDIPVSKKPAEVRMGKGKGATAYWVCRIQKGQVLFELDGVPKALAQQAARLAGQKLPFATTFISET